MHMCIYKSTCYPKCVWPSESGLTRHAETMRKPCGTAVAVPPAPPGTTQGPPDPPEPMRKLCGTYAETMRKPQAPST